MADNVSLEFLSAQFERVFAELRAIRVDQAELRDDIRVLTAIVLRHENTLKDILTQVTAMVSQHARFNERLRRLEGQPAE